MYRAAVIYAPADKAMKALAARIGNSLDKKLFSVSVKEAGSASIPDITAADLVLLGSTPQGKSPIHSDFAEMVRALAGINLAGRVAGLFALGSEATLQALKKALKDTDIKLAPENLLLAQSAEPAPKELGAWIGRLAAQLEEFVLGR